MIEDEIGIRFANRYIRDDQTIRPNLIDQNDLDNLDGIVQFESVNPIANDKSSISRRNHGLGDGTRPPL